MTTDRTALEAARDALTRLMRNFPTDSDMQAAGWEGCEIDSACKAHDHARAVVEQLDSALAALSSPPVLPAEPVAPDVVDPHFTAGWNAGLERARGLFAAVRRFRNEPRLERATGLRGTLSYGALVEAWEHLRDALDEAAAPQEAAPALDDARDAARAERDALLAERGDPKAAWCLCVQNGDRMRRAEGRLAWLHSSAACNVDGYEWGIFRVKWENGRATEVWQTASDFSDLDAAMQQEPRS